MLPLLGCDQGLLQHRQTAARELFPPQGADAVGKLLDGWHPRGMEGPRGSRPTALVLRRRSGRRGAGGRRGSARVGWPRPHGPSSAAAETGALATEHALDANDGAELPAAAKGPLDAVGGHVPDAVLVPLQNLLVALAAVQLLLSQNGLGLAALRGGGEGVTLPERCGARPAAIRGHEGALGAVTANLLLLVATKFLFLARDLLK